MPLHQLRVQPNTCGCNVEVVASLAHMMRTTSQDPPPVRVEADGIGFVIREGRHRYMAAIIAGRFDLLCELRA